MSLLPDFTTFKKLARKGNLVALVQSVPADLETPVSSFLKTTKGLSEAFLLESAEQEEKIGRYSFIGMAADTRLDRGTTPRLLNASVERTVERTSSPAHANSAGLPVASFEPHLRASRYGGQPSPGPRVPSPGNSRQSISVNLLSLIAF